MTKQKRARSCLRLQELELVQHQAAITAMNLQCRPNGVGAATQSLQLSTSKGLPISKFSDKHSKCTRQRCGQSSCTTQCNTTCQALVKQRTFASSPTSPVAPASWKCARMAKLQKRGSLLAKYWNDFLMLRQSTVVGS